MLCSNSDCGQLAIDGYDLGGGIRLCPNCWEQLIFSEQMTNSDTPEEGISPEEAESRQEGRDAQDVWGGMSMEEYLLQNFDD